MIDTHCHIDQYKNPLSVAKEAEKEGIITICPTNLPSHFQVGRQHLVGFKKVRLALGFHPLLVFKHPHEVGVFEQCLSMTSYIGEIGLDFSREGKPTKKLQVQVFKKIIQLISDRPRFISIHSRAAENEVLEVVTGCGIKNAVFHWYTGSLALLDQIAKAGYFFSVNPQMLNSQNGRKILERIPPDSLLTETDGPHVKISKRPAVPSDVVLMEQFYSSHWGVSCKEVQGVVRANFFKIIDSMAKV